MTLREPRKDFDLNCHLRNRHTPQHPKISITLAVMLSFGAVLSYGTTASAEICGGLDYAGKCEGTVIQWCENDEVIQLDCADLGAVCGWDAKKEYYTCMDADEVAESCPSENSYSGNCQDETTVVWCNSDGSVDTMACKDGFLCGWNDQMGYFDCIAPADPVAETEDATTDFGSESPSDEENESDRLSEEPNANNSRPIEGTLGNEDSDKADESSNTLSPPPSDPTVGCQQADSAPFGTQLFLMLICLVGLSIRHARS